MKLKKRIMALGMSLCIAASTLLSGGGVVPAAASTVLKDGYSRYGNRSCGNFFVNGERAFCMEHAKDSPGTGTAVTETPYDNDMIKTVLYYGWGGKGNIFSNEAEGVVRTSFALNYLYCGDSSLSNNGENGIDLAQPLLDYASENLISDMNIYFDKENVTAVVDGNKQKTENIRVNGDSRNSVTFNLPVNVVLHNTTTGEEKSGTVTIKGGDVFYLTAPLVGVEDFNTGELVGSMGYCQPLLLITSDSSTQNLVRLVWMDPPHKTSLNVVWQKTGNIAVSKLDAETGVAVEGAEYTVYNTKGESVGTIVTNAKGEGVLENLLAGEYTVKETKVPSGYFVDEATYPAIVTPGKTTPVGSQDAPIYGKIAVQKKDAETGNPKSQTSDNFLGAEYTVYAAEKNRDYEKDQKVAVLKVDESGLATSENLIHGKYYIRETKAPIGYLLDGKTYPVTISAHATEIVTYDVESPEQVIRGDLELIKVEDGTLNRMSGVLFSITNQFTGESHNFVTDENGYYNTASFWNSHSESTNRGETAEDGIWFGGSEPDDTKGALPFGVYTIEELPCEANKDHELIKFDVNIKRNSVTINLGSVTNDLTPLVAIGSIAKDDKTGLNQGIARKEMTIIDTVDYINLFPGREYTVKGILMDKNTGEPLQVDGKEITAEGTFTAKRDRGTVDVVFNFDGSSLAGTSVVVFEKLYYKDTEVAVHEDLEDEEQTVTYEEVKISTMATNQETDGKEITASETVTVRDAIEYINLIVGKEYTVKGILMDKSTGEPLLVDGKKITAEKTFVPEKKNGTVDVDFTFHASALAGTSVVVFEKMYYKDIEVAAHEDLKDEGQTVEIVEKVVPPTPAPPKPEQTEQVKTGDTTPIAVIVSLLAGSSVLICGLLYYKKHKIKF